jgi:hypothetical protein
MRFGRIILAILAPLVSLPALRTDLAAAPHPTSADSLSGLLRAVVPMATVYAGDTHQVASAYTPHAAPPIFGFFTRLSLPATWSPAAEATLRLLTRQHNRLQLRC